MASVRSESQGSLLPSLTSSFNKFTSGNVSSDTSGYSIMGYRLQMDTLSAVLLGIVALLALEQISYRMKKKHLPGPTWTIPIIGRFADSINPTMEKYHLSWANPLSAVSVFH